MREFQKHRGSGPGMEGFDSGAGSRKAAECAAEMERRKCAERRRTHAPGFMFISTVGWICRREARRRDTDPAPVD
jgi:hypothetical protein